MTDGFTVTDGSVEYKHSKPRAEYETVAPLVRLNFTIAEGSDADAVVAKVMGMAVRHGEGVLTGEVKSIAASGLPIEQAEKIIEGMADKPRRGRPAKENPTVVPAEPSSDAAPSGKSPSLVSDQDAEPEITLTLKGDIQPLAQKVSAHLAKVDGNINKLRAVIKECGGNSLLTIPEARWPEFIIEAKKLLP